MNSLGAVIGSFAGFADDTFTAVKDGYLFRFRLDGRFVPDDPGVLRYLSADCSGSAYIPAPDLFLPRLPRQVLYVGGQNRLYYFSNPLGQSVPVDTLPPFRSRYSEGGGCVAETNSSRYAWSLGELDPAVLEASGGAAGGGCCGCGASSASSDGGEGRARRQCSVCGSSSSSSSGEGSSTSGGEAWCIAMRQPASVST